MVAIEEFPNELLYQIMRYLNLRDVCSTAMVCRKLADATNYGKIWYAFTQRHFLLREKFNMEVNGFITRLGEQHSWKLCYILLYKIQNFRPAFFWDDAVELDLKPPQHQQHQRNRQQKRIEKSFYRDQTNNETGKNPINFQGTEQSQQPAPENINDSENKQWMETPPLMLCFSQAAIRLVHSFTAQHTQHGGFERQRNYTTTTATTGINSSSYWTLTREQIQEMAFLYGTIHSDYNLPKFTKVLLQIGTGPYQVCGETLVQSHDLHHLPLVTTRIINQFYMLRYREELFRYKRYTECYRTHFRRDCDSFFKNLRGGKILETHLTEQQQQQQRVSYERVCGVPIEDTQRAVLRAVVSLLRHFKLSSTALSKLTSVIDNSFKSNRWLSQVRPLIDWVLRLLTTATTNQNNTKRYTESERDRHVLRKHLLDANTTEMVVALEMTYRDQLNMTSYKLNEYIESVLLDKKRQDDEMYRFLDLIADDDKLEVRRLLQMQDNNLPSFVVKHFEQTFVANKTGKVQRLIDICEQLHILNNFFSLKNLLQGVRGVLSSKSSTKITWGDIGLKYMKKFVRLENIVKSDNDYREYRIQIKDTDSHRIPLLIVHLRDIQEELKQANARNSAANNNNNNKDGSTVARVLPDGCWYYMTPSVTKKTLEMIGTLYYYFIQK